MLKDYRTLKAKDLVTLQKDDTYFYYALKQWNPNTGDPIEPVVELLVSKEIDDERERLVGETADIDELKADLLKLTSSG